MAAAPGKRDRKDSTICKECALLRSGNVCFQCALASSHRRALLSATLSLVHSRSLSVAGANKVELPYVIAQTMADLERTHLFQFQHSPCLYCLHFCQSTKQHITTRSNYVLCVEENNATAGK